MYKTFLRIVISILFGASVYACGPTPPALPAYTLTPSVASKTASAQPTPSPTHTPAPETPVLYPGWTTYPDSRSIRDMDFDQKGNLWAAGPGGVVLLQPDGTHSRFTMKDGLPSNDVLSVGLDSHGVVWFGTRGGGVTRFDGKGWQTLTTTDGLAGNEVFSIADHTGYNELLFGTQNGLSVYNGSWANYAGPTYLPDDEIRAIAVFPHGSIWLGTRNGVTWFGPSETFSTADGLASDMVNAMVVAPDCGLWLGTSRGVSHYDGESWRSYTTANGLGADWVSAATATLDGAVWFGTRSGVSRFDGQTWTTYTTADGLPDDEVLSIAVAPDNTLWFGTAGGLSHYSPSIEFHPGEPDKAPEVSPGGASTLRIVYLKDGNLWLWSAGTKSQLTDDGRVSSMKLSGNGRMVAFTRLNDGLENELWVVNQDGSNEHLLVGRDDLVALPGLPESEQTGEIAREVVLLNYEWVPDQLTLAFDTRRHLDEPGTIWHDDLHLVEAETGERTTLLPPGRGGRFYYSPDGLQVAIVTPNYLSIMNADGSHWREKLLEYSSVMTYSEYRYYPRPVWSADSQFLLLALPPKDPLAVVNPPQPTTLWRIPADGAPASLLGSITPAGTFALSVAFSPDLTRLAYLTEAGEPAENQRKLHIANIDGTGDSVEQEGLKLRFLGWSQDGQHFIYSFGDPETWYIGGINDDSTPLAFDLEDLAWINGDTFLHVENLGCALELRLTRLNDETLVIDRMWQPPVSFDFADR